MGGKRRASPARVAEIFRRFANARPDPVGELEYVNPYTLLVAVVLSAQATDAGVNKATRGLFKVADAPDKMLALGLQEIEQRIRTIGLYRNKARNIVALSEKLLAEHGGQVPAEREALEALPGVGRKTASVVLNIAFGQPTLAVDTHVYRVAHRLDLAPGKTPFEVEMGLLKVIPGEFLRHAHAGIRVEVFDEPRRGEGVEMVDDRLAPHVNLLPLDERRDRNHDRELFRIAAKIVGHRQHGGFFHAHRRRSLSLRPDLGGQLVERCLRHGRRA